MSDKTDTPLSLLAAVAQVRSRGLVAIKKSRNAGLNSDYASIVDVWEVLNPELLNSGLSVGFLLGACRKEGADWVQAISLVVSNGTESDTAAFEFCFPEGNRGTNLAQRQGMCQTYARRYALVSYFNLITGDDDDAQRLGMGLAEDSPSIKPKDDAHFSDFCYAPALGLGHEETQGTWGNLQDPFGDGSQMLGDHSEKSLANMSYKDCESIGLKAWLAERVSGFAAEHNLTTYEQVRNRHPHPHMLPANAADLTGDQLRGLSQALKPAAPKTGKGGN